MQRDQIEWQDGTPVSTLYGDPFFSRQDGLAETRHVFLGGNDLPARFRPGFHIAETGFGTGLNALCAWAAWRASGQTGQLAFTSFEAHPISARDMARAHAAFPQMAALSDLLLAEWRTGRSAITLPGLDLRIVVGDARETLPGWEGRADAWFLDGFAPARNPALWSEALLAEVARHTAPGGTAATYTAAGHVRRALQAGGFDVTRMPGWGRKRHMTRAVLRAGQSL
ncbi:tRNA (5-methylaminomethyl-2-thiouridine)(34)-methyltransferase MnmD [Oceaniovalibus guishaninsula]|nr:tRNA (5-methylaminomethyl-2-thiouridine)(34)-methyltransferase MnmD [Oceaniovalibus guishaninsula]